jgi:hypothetical protein
MTPRDNGALSNKRGQNSTADGAISGGRDRFGTARAD